MFTSIKSSGIIFFSASKSEIFRNNTPGLLRNGFGGDGGFSCELSSWPSCPSPPPFKLFFSCCCSCDHLSGVEFRSRRTASRGSQQRGGPLPGEHAGGSPNQGAYSQLHVELSRWCAPEGCCLRRLRAVDTHRASRRSFCDGSGHRQRSTGPWRTGSHSLGAWWDDAFRLARLPGSRMGWSHTFWLGFGFSFRPKAWLPTELASTRSSLARSFFAPVPARLASALGLPKANDSQSWSWPLFSDGHAPQAQSQACLDDAFNQAEG